MAFQLRIKPSAEKKLKKLPEKEYYKIISAFAIIAGDPFAGKKMEGKYKGCYTYRVWPYRIIYQILKNELVVLVVSVGHRQGVY